MSHLTYTVLLAILLSAVVALTGHRSARDRAYLATYVFLTCIVGTVAGGWLM